MNVYSREKTHLGLTWFTFGTNGSVTVLANVTRAENVPKVMNWAKCGFKAYEIYGQNLISYFLNRLCPVMIGPCVAQRSKGNEDVVHVWWIQPHSI